MFVQYKGYYKTNDKISHIFHHKINGDFVEAIMMFSSICQNYILDDNDNHEWESHIFQDRFVVLKVITEEVQLACNIFKEKLRKKKCLVLMTLHKLDLQNNIQQHIFNLYFGRSVQDIA
jgi:hypothetical protein